MPDDDAGPGRDFSRACTLMAVIGVTFFLFRGIGAAVRSIFLVDCAKSLSYVHRGG